jgi:ubiquitin C-terminal hydrolase
MLACNHASKTSGMKDGWQARPTAIHHEILHDCMIAFHQSRKTDSRHAWKNDDIHARFLACMSA